MCKKLIYLVSFVLVLGLILTSTASAELVAWWKFDGDYTDSTGNGHDGDPQGDTTLVEGQYGQAVRSRRQR